MNLLADESVDRQIVEKLREDGHYVWYVTEMQAGIPDTTVLELANREGAVLLTADKDIGELVFRQSRISHGVILVRLAGLSPSRKATIVSQGLRAHEQDMFHAFSVIAAGSIRIRRQSQS